MTYLPDKSVQEFKNIWESKTKRKLTDGEYRIKAENFLLLFWLVSRLTDKKELIVK